MSNGLASPAAVNNLASGLLKIGDSLHATLRRLSDANSMNVGETYRLLTEEYALKSRVHALAIQPQNYVVHGLKIKDEELGSLLDRVNRLIQADLSHEQLSIIVADLIAFTAMVFTKKPHLIELMGAELEGSLL
ncbi:hypothetical protein [Pseudogulbenkiania sp. MAI-1]|uniref:hypothetical protein n=1 Tax=Pseudogulbenkiania sp. MAI-1 TaxID=990370 RepID=UPI0012EBD549|nr:hypothetical protein [Pseudogulbenkiania sp. MAI-1]